MMSKQKERDEFIATMTKEGVPVDVARLLLRHAATLHRLAELECSSEAADRDRVPCPRGFQTVDWCLCRDYGSFDAVPNRIAPPRRNFPHGTVPRIAVRAAQVQRRVEEILKPFPGVVPVFSGDPRGAVLKLKVPSGRTDDWGRTGVCVP